MATYDAFAEAFELHAATGAYNAHYDRPALLGLLGSVDGLTVLDAGCGPGLYAEALVERGAEVIGVDASTEMIRLAERRLRGRGTFLVHDLEEPLDWAEDASFDVVVMALVLHHLEDPQQVLRELHRVLREDGRLVISTVHPVADWRRYGGNYFTDERVTETWGGGWEVEFRRAPLTDLVADFSAAGFAIGELLEPRPLPTMTVDHPDISAKLATEPGFIVFSLIKNPLCGR